MIGDQRLAAPSTPQLSECALPLSYASLYRLSDERFGMPDDLPYSKNEKWFLPPPSSSILARWKALSK